MSSNKRVIEAYMARTATAEIAHLLADDVEWVEWGDGVPATGARTTGKAAFLANFGEDELRTDLTRMTEEGNVVVAEGTCHVRKKDGSRLAVRFCNIFEMESGKIKRLSSFGALLKGPA